MNHIQKIMMSAFLLVGIEAVVFASVAYTPQQKIQAMKNMTPAQKAQFQTQIAQAKATADKAVQSKLAADKKAAADKKTAAKKAVDQKKVAAEKKEKSDKDAKTSQQKDSDPSCKTLYYDETKHHKLIGIMDHKGTCNHPSKSGEKGNCTGKWFYHHCPSKKPSAKQAQPAAKA